MSFHTVFSAALCLLLGTSSSLSIPGQGRSQSLRARSISQGWSLQSSSCPSGSNSCGGGACCPSSLYCIAAARDEVAACCTSDSACRGSIEGGPVCADSSWSLWKGYQGNGFCCEYGMVGAYQNGGSVAGSCYTAVPAGQTSASIMSSGTPSAAPTSTTTTVSSPMSTGSKPTTTSRGAPAATGKPIFFHYMIGTITDAHCEQDIVDAANLGVDGFALNLNTVTASWAQETVNSLFKYAQQYNLKLFFSFDMTGFTNPNQFVSYLNSWVTNPAYFHYQGYPLVSSFNGGTGLSCSEPTVNDCWNVELQQAMANYGHPIIFIPAFQDVTASSTFFDTYPTLNGTFNWNSWPFSQDPDQGQIVVPTTDDVTYENAAHSSGRYFMMGVSALQFKHDPQFGNYYRRGEENIEYRFGQVLNLQPDLVEFQTWNDAGESHYMGNSWPEPISGTDIGEYTTDFPHTAYWEIIPAFIKAWKSGATTTAGMVPTNGNAAQGTFWHHPVLTTSDCSSDSIGEPQGLDDAQNLVTAVVLVAEDEASLQASISVGGTTLGTQDLSPGYNHFSVSGLQPGTVSMEVTNTENKQVLASGTGTVPVAATASVCNFNFQVVALE